MIKGGKWLQQLDKRHSVLGHRVLGGCWWPLQIHARSNRNAGRHHRGFAGDFPRNPQASFSVARIVKCSPKTLRKRYRDDLDFGVAEANAIVSGLRPCLQPEDLCDDIRRGEQRGALDQRPGGRVLRSRVSLAQNIGERASDKPRAATARKHWPS